MWGRRVLQPVPHLALNLSRPGRDYDQMASWTAPRSPPIPQLSENYAEVDQLGPASAGLFLVCRA
jgi:hypothetical protein